MDSYVLQKLPLNILFWGLLMNSYILQKLHLYSKNKDKNNPTAACGKQCLYLCRFESLLFNNTRIVISC